jgi:hypothetical protein
MNTQFVYFPPIQAHLAVLQARVTLLRENGAEDSLAVTLIEREIAELQAAIEQAQLDDEWDDTGRAANVLGVSPRRVTALCKADRLVWTRDGARSPYRISMRSVYDLRGGRAA